MGFLCVEFSRIYGEIRELMDGLDWSLEAKLLSKSDIWQALIQENGMTNLNKKEKINSLSSIYGRNDYGD